MNRTWLSCALGGLLVVGATLVGCEEQRPVAPPPPDETTEPAPPPPPAEGAAAAMQTMCPVGGNPIDETVFVMHEGQRVYFCCDRCKAPFESEPQKYLSKLPQFGGQEEAPGA